jgi:hypothetical protein
MGEPRVPDHYEYGPGGNPFCLGCTTTPVAWSAIPAQVDAYQMIGYGGINSYSVNLARAVLLGKTALPVRAGADAQYELDQTLRSEVFFSSVPDSETKVRCLH